MKKGIVVLSVIVLAVAAYGFYLFNKKTESLQHVAPDFTVTADALFSDFDSNESVALKKYEGKIIQVTGKVIMVSQTDSISNVLLYAEDAMLGGINCSFNSLEDVVKKDERLTIKGQCQGFITSVILNNCTILK